MPWDSTMPSGLTDGDIVDEGDLDPVFNNVNYLRFAAVLVGGIERVSNDASTSGTTERVWLTTPPIALDANTTYMVDYGCKYAVSAANNSFVVRAREDNIAGADRISFAGYLSTEAGVGYYLGYRFFYKTTGAVGAKSFVGTIARLTGAVTATVSAQSSILIYRIGTNTILSTV